MKLRNKKTGDIWEFDGGFSMKASRETTEKAGGRGCSLTCYARSIAELNNDWEDYNPAEPLIKDEKIRKAVRVWAEANKIDVCICKEEMHCITFETERGMFISFENADLIPPEGNYTIAELCGEEEE
jgi:hypothetical protein